MYNLCGTTTLSLNDMIGLIKIFIEITTTNMYLQRWGVDASNTDHELGSVCGFCQVIMKFITEMNSSAKMYMYFGHWMTIQQSCAIVLKSTRFIACIL